MTDAIHEQVDRISNANEIEIAPQRSDGTLGRPTPIWIVRTGGGVFVRSWRGANGRWFASVTETGEGHTSADGNELDVVFEAAPNADRRAIDDAYRAKYGRSTYVGAMVTDTAAATTLRLRPHGSHTRKEVST